MSSMSRVQVNKRSDLLPFAVFVDRIGIMGRIQKEFFNVKLRKIGFHSEKGVQERKHIMPGSPFQKWENRKITMGIRSHIYVEVVAKEIAFPVRIPAPVAVRLRVVAFTVTGRTAIIPAVAEPPFPLLCSSTDRSPVTGKGKMSRINQPVFYGFAEELLIV